MHSPSCLACTRRPLPSRHDIYPHGADRLHRMRKVVTYGTFDLFHIGHLRLLERLRALGDHLTVFVSSDEFNLLKGKSCVIDYAERSAIVAALSCVDSVFPENSWEQKVEDIQRLQIDVFGMGDDWAQKFDYLRPYCEVVYISRTEGVSSTLLKRRILGTSEQGIVEIVRTGLSKPSDDNILQP
jgi:glycerol-3-phosphate cytidylyltransferase